ncbi:MAG: AAA family ATPase [Planctomycetota bacterium]
MNASTEDTLSAEALIAAFQDPGTYPHPVPEGVELVQTHISRVFLAGDWVYKLKKPVDLGFLDYSTLEQRRACCEAEVELNRRLAPRVYERVARITREADGSLALDGAGETVDYAVVMRRLPAERTFKARVAAGALTVAEVEALAELLADFHARAARDPRIAAFGEFATVAGNCRENFTQLEPFRGSTIHPEVHRRLAAATEARLEALQSSIEARVRRGAPCDCHGDLRLEHVYALDDGLVVVDCIEFNERFRYGDPLADLAFPVMELERALRPDLAHALTERYFARAGEDGRELLEHYLAYRAVVRGKVRSFKAAQDEVPQAERRAARDRARGHFLYALSLLAPPGEGPLLLLVGGLPASGKSTLARGLAERGFRWIRADAVRKELAGLAPEDSAAAEFEGGLYTRAHTERTYATCLERAQDALFAGERVLVDASFSRAADRARFAAAAAELGVPCRVLVCEASPETTRARLAARVQTGDASDADWAIYQRMAAAFEPVTEAQVTRIDTEGSPAASIEAAFRAVGTC